MRLSNSSENNRRRGNHECARIQARRISGTDHCFLRPPVEFEQALLAQKHAGVAECGRIILSPDPRERLSTNGNQCLNWLSHIFGASANFGKGAMSSIPTQFLSVKAHHSRYPAIDPRLH